MRDVRNSRCLASLSGMLAGSEDQRLLKAWAKRGDCFTLGFHQEAELLHIVDQDYVAVYGSARQEQLLTVARPDAVETRPVGIICDVLGWTAIESLAH